MTSVKKVALAAALTITMGGMGLSPAKAGTETWDFLNPTGLLGTTQAYSSSPSGLVLNAAGFQFGATNLGTLSIDFSAPTALFGKNLGGDENGLGISNNLAGNTANEITAGISFVRTQIPSTLLNPVLSQFGSTTAGETWEILGSNSATTGYSVVATGMNELTDINLHPATCPTCIFFAFFATGAPGGIASNVLIHQITGVSQVPLPGAAALFGTGLGLLALLGSRRKRKAQAPVV